MGKIADLIGATVIRALLLLLLFGARLIAEGHGSFLVLPFLHPGEFGKQNKYRLKLAWVSGDENDSWAVDLKMESQSDWRTMAYPTRQIITDPEKAAGSVYQTNLELDSPDTFFNYRVRREGRVVFEAQARPPVGLGKPQRVLMVGGITSPSVSMARSIAFRDANLFIASDRAVDSITVLGKSFFDVFNADRPYPGLGGPCLRSSVWVTPFLNSQVTPSYQNGNYSFDTGDVHWIVLNSIAESDIQQTQLWLESDLASARKDAWKVVVVHDAPVHSGKGQIADSKNLVWLPLMERFGVDLVLSGGVHNYQRTMPVSFRANQFTQDGLPGSFVLDRDWNGATRTKAKGTIYVVSGAGRDLLADQDRDDAPETWQLYSTIFKSSRPSYSLLEIDGGWLQFSQLDSNGRVLDRFVLTR